MAYRPRNVNRQRRDVVRGWLAYCVCLAAIYVFARETNRSLAAMLGIGALVAIPAARNALRRAKARRFDAAAKLGLALLAQDRNASAEAEFSRLQQCFRSPAFLPRIAEYYRALAILKQGRIPEAIESLARIDAAGGVHTIDAQLAINLAYAHALCGALDDATAWLAAAKRRTKGALDVIPELVIDLRDGRALAVRDRLEAQWKTLEGRYTGAVMRRVRLLQAFAVAQTVGPREAGAIETVLAPLRPASSDEFAYMAKHWPELDQFLRTYVS